MARLRNILMHAMKERIKEFKKEKKGKKERKKVIIISGRSSSSRAISSEYTIRSTTTRAYYRPGSN